MSLKTGAIIMVPVVFADFSREQFRLLEETAMIYSNQ